MSNQKCFISGLGKIETKNSSELLVSYSNLYFEVPLEDTTDYELNEFYNFAGILSLQKGELEARFN